MTFILRKASVLIWLISFAMPTALTVHGKNIFGYEIFAEALLLSVHPLVLIFAPLHLTSFATNIIPISEAIDWLTGSTREKTLKEGVVLYFAIILNIIVIIHFGNHGLTSWSQQDITNLPGYYFWISSFILLAIAASIDNAEFFAGLWLRIAALTTAIFATIFIFAVLYGIFVWINGGNHIKSRGKINPPSSIGQLISKSNTATPATSLTCRSTGTSRAAHAPPVN